ncbi:MAG: NAD(P)-dependent oxidoreductase, partial [Gemmatimonadota bacterium]
MAEEENAGRLLLIWMHSDTYPAWRIPSDLVEQLATDGAGDWEVRAIRVPAEASGDGPRAAPPEVLEAIGDAEVYFGYGITSELLEAAGRLEWFHSGAAGVGGSLRAGARERELIVTNSAGIYATPLAEWSIGAMLYFARGFDLAVIGMRTGDWPYHAMAGEGTPLRELEGSTVAIVGYGGIGRAVGMRARALGMNVWAVRARPGSALLP